MNYANVEVTIKVLHPLQIQEKTYKWLGKPHWVLRATRSDIDILPFRMVKIKDLDFDYAYYVRADAYFPYGWTLRILYVIQRYWQWFFIRFIATLNIWNLAYTPLGSVPSIKDIGKKVHK